MAKSQPLMGMLKGAIGDTVHYGSRRVRSRGVYPECSSPEYRWAIGYLSRQYDYSQPLYKTWCLVKPGCGPRYSGLMGWAKYIALASTFPSYGIYASRIDKSIFPRDEYVDRYPVNYQWGNCGLTSRWYGAGYQILWKPTFMTTHLKYLRMYYLLLPVGIASGHMGHLNQYLPWAGVCRTDWPVPAGSGYYSWLDTRRSQSVWVGSRPMVIFNMVGQSRIDDSYQVIGGGYCSSPG